MMHPAEPLRVFGYPGWVRGLGIFAALVFCAMAAVSYVTEGWTWTTVVLAGLAPVAIAGVADAFTCRIELHPESLVVVAGFRRREYPRSGFAKVTWGKGVPISLQYIGGGWLVLPGVGTGQGTVNTVRAWLNR